MRSPNADGDAMQVRRVAIVGNPRAGSHGEAEGPDVLRSAFARRGVRADLVDVADARAVDAVACAEGEDAPDVIVAAGGDGTINAVANALAGRDRVMGIVPMGTFNYVARRYGLPEEAQAAVDVVLEGRTLRIDAGDVNGRLFLVNCSLGLYTSIIDARERHNRSFGRNRLVALLSAMKILVTPHRRPRVRVEHARGLLDTRASMVLIGANPLQLDGIDPEVAAAVERGALAIVVVRAVDLWRLLKFAWKALTGKVAEAPEIEAFVVDDARVWLRAARVRVVVDGETVVLPTPLALASRPGALRLRVPLPVEPAAAPSPTESTRPAHADSTGRAEAQDA